MVVGTNHLLRQASVKAGVLLLTTLLLWLASEALTTTTEERDLHFKMPKRTIESILSLVTETPLVFWRHKKKGF